MKVIDLLNKIAKGEEIPNEIKYNNIDYYWCKECKIYERFEDGRKDLYNDLDNLNDEVEIIEDKKIEKLSFGDLSGTPKRANENDIIGKINEIIEVLNEKIFNNA